MRRVHVSLTRGAKREEQMHEWVTPFPENGKRREKASGESSKYMVVNSGSPFPPPIRLLTDGPSGS